MIRFGLKGQKGTLGKQVMIAAECKQQATDENNPAEHRFHFTMIHNYELACGCIHVAVFNHSLFLVFNCLSTDILPAGCAGKIYFRFLLRNTLAIVHACHG
jgi:hypothetical protein